MPSETSGPLLHVDDVQVTVQRRRSSRAVLTGVTLKVFPSESVAIMGQSGSGKSTLLRVIAGMTPPDQGKVVIAGVDMAHVSPEERVTLRGREIGMVFQDFRLIDHLTAAMNIELAAILHGMTRTEAQRRSEELGEALGIVDDLDVKPPALSGGQQQRVALARALVSHPSLILADEPTGSLDAATAHDAVELLLEGAGAGRGVVIVTHDPAVAARADRCLRLEGGRLIE